MAQETLVHVYHPPMEIHLVASDFDLLNTHSANSGITQEHHMPKNIYTLMNILTYFINIWDVSRKMLTLFGTPDSTPFREFRISPIHYIYTTEFVSLRTMFTD